MLSTIFGAYLFLAASLISIPVYLAILYVIAGHRRLRVFGTAFYSVVLSNGIFDLAGAVLFAVAGCAPLTIFKEVFWNSRKTYLPVIGLALNVMFLYIRLFGLVTLVLERTFATLCRTSTYIKWQQRPICCSSTIIRWLIALTLSWPMFIQMDISYKKNSHGEIMPSIPADRIQTDILLAGVVTWTCVLVNSTIYAGILLKMVTKCSMPVDHEWRYTLQALVLTLAPAAMAVHFTYIYITIDKARLPTNSFDEMTRWFMLYNVLLSYLPPWLLLLFNEEIRKGLAAIGNPAVTPLPDGNGSCVIRIPICSR
ncbi:unnamed protein product [Nippostrongylus brasiliensis]|uniref:G protein-coupled receptor n=1 Tax=Nippostrongylus brasiliensis TaxID=27835 RepID=A0A0N4Y0V3_NIPBR|nr:unnamed protein product [Nippostrongylus brasiliensis]